MKGLCLVTLGILLLSGCSLVSRMGVDNLGVEPVVKLCAGLDGVPDSCVQVGTGANVQVE